MGTNNFLIVGSLFLLLSLVSSFFLSVLSMDEIDTGEKVCKICVNQNDEEYKCDCEKIYEYTTMGYAPFIFVVIAYIFLFLAIITM